MNPAARNSDRDPVSPDTLRDESSAKPTPPEEKQLANDSLIAPHGGSLVDRLATDAEAQQLAAEAQSLPKLSLAMRPLSDLEMIAVGAFSPITGFMTKRDYEGVVKDMHLGGG